MNSIVSVLDGTSSLSFGTIGVQDYTKIQDGVDSVLTRLRPGQAGNCVSITGGRDFYSPEHVDWPEHTFFPPPPPLWNITRVCNNGIADVFQLLTSVSIRLTTPFSDCH